MLGDQAGQRLMNCPATKIRFGKQLLHTIRWLEYIPEIMPKDGERSLACNIIFSKKERKKEKSTGVSSVCGQMLPSVR